MFGLVNKALADMLCANFGERVWNDIKTRAEVDVEVFISMEPYPDEITYRLIAASSEILGRSEAEIIEGFGFYWVLFTATEGYGKLLSIAGDTLPELLQNLDNINARIGLSFPKAKTPAFRCSQIRANSLHLHYYSERRGLAPLVIGMIKGMAEKFQIAVEVAVVKSKDKGDPNDEFLIKYMDRCQLSDDFLNYRYN
jgi:hypothetical protein